MDLSPLSEGIAPLPPPPRPHFRGAFGRPRQVNVTSQQLPNLPATSAAAKAGMRYEDSVQTYLQKEFWADRYLRNPRVEFLDDSGRRSCYPDGILYLPDRIVIFEVKLQHMPEAWWQLKRLYAPVIAECLDVSRRQQIQLIEIVKSYDPQMPFPVEVEIIESLRSWVSNPMKIDVFGVLVWKP